MRIILFTGPINSGKTCWLQQQCQLFYQQHPDSGQQLRSFLALGLWQGGEKVGFQVQDSLDGSSWPLVVAGSGQPRFIPLTEGFARVRERLLQLQGCSLLILDEVGNFELRGAGHCLALQDLLARQPCERLLLVVRDSLVASVCEYFALPRWPLQIVHFDDQLPSGLEQFCLPTVVCAAAPCSDAGAGA